MKRTTLALALIGLFALPTVATAAQTKVAVRNLTDRAVAIHLEVSPSLTYCVAPRSEGHYGAAVISVSIMAGNSCMGTAVHKFPVESDVRLIEVIGADGKYYMTARSG